MITLISKDFCGSVLSWRRDANGRVISLLISYGDVRINVVNIYAPTNLAGNCGAKYLLFKALPGRAWHRQLEGESLRFAIRWATLCSR